jgi:hypothetical protein
MTKEMQSKFNTLCDCNSKKVFILPENHPDPLDESVKEFRCDSCVIEFAGNYRSIYKWSKTPECDESKDINYKDSKIRINYFLQKPDLYTPVIVECFNDIYYFRIKTNVILSKEMWSIWVKNKYNRSMDYEPWRSNLIECCNKRLLKYRNYEERLIETTKEMIDYINSEL